MRRTLTLLFFSLYLVSLLQVGASASIGQTGETSDEGNPRRASNRRPSATLAFVLMTQLQFLATLSLVDYTVRQDSWFGDFITGLRCDKQMETSTRIPVVFFSDLVGSTGEI